MPVKYPPGEHVLLDYWDAERLTDSDFISRALTDAAEAAGATVIQTFFHVFGENGGVTGVAILAESHLSIHTWPESAYAALDLFLCGGCRADLAIEVLQSRFKPGRQEVKRLQRGNI